MIFVIPGRAQREPGIHNHRRNGSTLQRENCKISDYGFRVRGLKPAPRNDGYFYFASFKNVTASMRLPSQSRMKAA